MGRLGASVTALLISTLVTIVGIAGWIMYRAHMHEIGGCLANQRPFGRSPCDIFFDQTWPQRFASVALAGAVGAALSSLRIAVAARRGRVDLVPNGSTGLSVE